MPSRLPPLELARPDRAVPVGALARNPRAPLLAMPGLGQLVLLADDGAPIGALPCEWPTVSRAAFSTDGQRVALAGGEAGRRGRVAVHDITTGALLGTVGAERDLPLALALHGDLVAIGGASKRARVFSLESGERLLNRKHDDFILDYAFAPDGVLLAAADRSGTVVLWDIEHDRAETKLKGHDGAVHAVAFQRDGRVVTAGHDGTVRSWDPKEGKQLWRQTAHRGQALALAIGPDGAIATCGSDGRVAVYTRGGKRTALSGATGDWLYAVAFGADDKTVFAGGQSGVLYQYDLASKKVTTSAPLGPVQ